MVKYEKVIIENQNIKSFIDKSFLEQVNKISKTKTLFPVSIVFIAEKKIEGKRAVCPIVLSHESNKDVTNKILRIESPDPELLDDFIKMFEKVKGK